MKQLPNLDEKNKERPLCFGYSVKARALLHAHFARLPLPPNSLEEGIRMSQILWSFIKKYRYSIFV